jgi:acyl-CoA dehydrogenase family protein 9
MTEAAAAQSFSKSLVLGEIEEDLVFPFPVRREPAEEDRIRALNSAFRAYAAEHVDSREIDRAAWIEDHVFRDLGELGLMGLYVPEEYGGQGLSQTGYARVFETLGQADGSLTVAMGVHQSIGMKGIVMFGTDEQ